MKKVAHKKDNVDKRVLKILSNKKNQIIKDSNKLKEAHINFPFAKLFLSMFKEVILLK
jgi:hypothetical protein